MSSRIVAVYEYVNTQLLSILDLFAKKEKDRKSVVFKYTNIWDDQIDEMIFGDGYAFNSPAAFIEFTLGKGTSLGMKFTSFQESMIRIHILSTVLNSENPKMEQNLEVFKLRDYVVTKLKNSNIPFCSSVALVEDKQDYKHKNTYVYVLGFLTNFIDSKGSLYDEDSGAIYDFIKGFNINVLFGWQSGTHYFILNKIIYQGEVYICISENSDTEFKPDNWYKIQSWVPAQYIVGNVVCFYSYIYICVIDNNDTDFDINKWTQVL